MRHVQVLALAGLISGSAASAAVFAVGDSNAPWLGYMNVFNLPADGGAFQFGSPWGKPDLNTTFDDVAGTLTLSPNTIGDPNPYWYIGGGGPGAQGNKIMEANLYQEFNGSLAGQTVTFQGNVLSNSFTGAHSAIAFVKDYAPDFSSFTVSQVALTPGAFSISLNTINDPARHVQFGFQVVGVDVWFTDTAPFGNAVISTPAPGSLALVGVCGVIAARRRRQA